VICITPDFFSLDTSTKHNATFNPLLSGPGALYPDIAPLLREFSDVLQTETPGGLPPQCFAADGSAIEHCIPCDKEMCSEVSVQAVV
jgi:hypothetical protein